MPKGLNNDMIQRTNRSLILRNILERKVVSRIQLAKLTGLKKPTITNIVNDLLKLDIIEECDMEKKEGYRKTEGLQIRANGIKIVAARWIREFFSASIYTLSGTEESSVRCEISTNDEIDIALDKIFCTIDKLVSGIDQDKIIGMCVGVPGPYIRGKKNIAIVTGYEKLSEIDIQKTFETHYSFPVFTEHDGRLQALAEWNYMDFKEKEKSKCLLALQSLGIGIGAGIVEKGKTFPGAFGIAGEIGQLGIYFNGPKNHAGERGTLEHYASSYSVKEYVRQRLMEYPESQLNENSPYNEIVEAYYANDPLAEWAFDSVANRLAYGLTGIIFIISPDKIIIGPEYPNNERFLQKVKDGINSMVSPEISDNIDIRFSSYKGDPTVSGAYYYVLERFLHDSSIYERVKNIQTN